MSGYLVVRARGELYGLDVRQVLEVVDEFEVFKTLSVHAAVRGVTPVRERLVPVIHLGTLLDDQAPPEKCSKTAVLATRGDTLVALEIDDADSVEYETPLPVPAGWQLPWASGVVKRNGELVPIIDVELLVEHMAPAEVLELK